MVKRNAGVILNIASDLGVIAPDQRLYRKQGLPEDQQPVKPVTYSVVKTGLIGLTRYLSTYWTAHNIRVNAISPGGVFAGQPDEFTAKLHQLIPWAAWRTRTSTRARSSPLLRRQLLHDRPKSNRRRRPQRPLAYRPLQNRRAGHGATAVPLSSICAGPAQSINRDVEVGIVPHIRAIDDVQKLLRIEGIRPVLEEDQRRETMALPILQQLRHRGWGDRIPGLQIGGIPLG